MSVTLRDQAIVLKTVPIRDADRHYVVFTRNHGKMTLLAKGTRRGRSKMSPHMGSIGTVEIMVARGKAFDRLAGASLQKGYPAVSKSLSASSMVQGFLAVVDALTRREQPEPAIFDLMQELFETVSRPLPSVSADGRGPAFDAALLRLLDILGLAPEIDSCVTCRIPLDGKRSSLSLTRGGLECGHCGSGDSIPVLAETAGRLRRFRVQDLMESAKEAPPHHLAGQVMEGLLAYHAQDWLPAVRYLRKVAG